jgi:hypothetical protein
MPILFPRVSGSRTWLHPLQAKTAAIINRDASRAASEKTSGRRTIFAV